MTGFMDVKDGEASENLTPTCMTSFGRPFILANTASPLHFPYGLSAQ